MLIEEFQNWLIRQIAIHINSRPKIFFVDLASKLLFIFTFFFYFVRKSLTHLMQVFLSWFPFSYILAFGYVNVNVLFVLFTN